MTTFLISDTHFSHKNILSFLNEKGEPLRNFNSIEEHDDYLIRKWNSVVRPKDKVYHLGDVSMTNWTNTEAILNQLNGDKVLIRGNHDQHKLFQYAKVFKDVRAYHQLNGFILSHIPIHPESLGRWKGNIHGHLHSNNYDSAFYFNVCVEQLRYTPISLEELEKQFNDKNTRNP